MPHRYQLVPSPARSSYIRQQTLDPGNLFSYATKLYFAQSGANFPSSQNSVYNDLLLEQAPGTDHLLLEQAPGTNVLYLENSSQLTSSLFYAFKDSEPVYYSGISYGNSQGNEVTYGALVFPPKFFRPGNLVRLEFSGNITSNSTDTGLTFTLTFPDTMTAATVTMPATVGAGDLGVFQLVVTTGISYDTDKAGLATHAGTLLTENSAATEGVSPSLVSYASNSFAFEDTLYYLFQYTWNQDSGAEVTFNSLNVVLL